MVRIGKNLSYACARTESQLASLVSFWNQYGDTYTQDYGESFTINNVESETTYDMQVTTSSVRNLLIPGEIYTLSYITTYDITATKNYYAKAKLLDGTYVDLGKSLLKNGSITFVMPENVNNIRLYIRLTGNDSTTVSHVMLERGYITTAYEPYNESETIIVNQIMGGGTISTISNEFTHQEIVKADDFSYAVNTVHDYDLSWLNGKVFLDHIYYQWSNTNPNYSYGPQMKWEIVYDDDTTVLLGTENWVADRNTTHTSNLYLRPSIQYNKKIKYLRGTRTGTYSGTAAAATFKFTNFKIYVIKIANA